MYHVYLNWAAGVYLFLYFFNFLSFKFQNIIFFVTLFCEAYKVETWYTHGGNWLIYCVHQIQAARIYLFLYFSSFFCLSNTGFALPVAIIAKCEEKIFLAQKNVIWRKQMAKNKSKEKIAIQILPTLAVYCHDFTLLQIYKSPIKTFMYLSKS